MPTAQILHLIHAAGMQFASVEEELARVPPAAQHGQRRSGKDCRL